MMKEQFNDVQKINNILKNNKKRRIVAIFKDFLIFDEVAEVISQKMSIRQSLKIISEVALDQQEMKDRYQSFHQTPNYYSLSDVRRYLYENTVTKFQNYFEKIKSSKNPLNELLIVENKHISNHNNNVNGVITTGSQNTLHKHIGCSSTETLIKIRKKYSEEARINADSAKDKLIMSSFVKPYSFQSIPQQQPSVWDNLEEILNNSPSVEFIESQMPKIKIVNELKEMIIKQEQRHLKNQSSNWLFSEPALDIDISNCCSYHEIDVLLGDSSFFRDTEGVFVQKSPSLMVKES